MRPSVRRLRRTETGWRRGHPQLIIDIDAHEAVEFGRWLLDTPGGDKDLANDLIRLAHEAWEDEGR